MVAADWPYDLINICDVVRIVIHRRHIRWGNPLPCNVANHRFPVPILVNRASDQLAVSLKADSDRAFGPIPALGLRRNPMPDMRAADYIPAHPI